jgi:hypothetical protein
MPKDFRYTTNIEDLLDDGIENNSDLIGRASNIDPELPIDPNTIRIGEETIAMSHAKQATEKELAQGRSYSLFGVLLGIGLSISGLALAVHPIDMNVEHSRMKYLPSSVEHVTTLSSRLYGMAVFGFGLAVLGFSLIRPRD